MRHDLRRPRAVVLHNIIVRHTGYERDCAGEEGEPEALIVGMSMSMGK